MADPGRPIPGQTKIPFHVGVVHKKVAHVIESHVKGVAVACRNQLPFRTFGVDIGHPASGFLAVVSVPARVFDFGKKVVVLPGLRQFVGIHSGQIGVIATNHVQRFFIRRKFDAVGAVLTFTDQVFEQGQLVELIVAIGILQTVKTGTFGQVFIRTVVDHHVQTVEGIQQTMGCAKSEGVVLEFYFFDLRC